MNEDGYSFFISSFILLKSRREFGKADDVRLHCQSHFSQAVLCFAWSPGRLPSDKNCQPLATHLAVLVTSRSMWPVIGWRRQVVGMAAGQPGPAGGSVLWPTALPRADRALKLAGGAAERPAVDPGMVRRLSTVVVTDETAP